MDIFDMARNLGRAISESPEMARLNLAREAQNNNEEALMLIGEYNLKRMQLGQRASKPDITDEEMSAIREELSAEYEKLLQNDIVLELLNAQKEAEELMNKIHGILDFYVSGSEPTGGCTHDCSTCGGCH